MKMLHPLSRVAVLNRYHMSFPGLLRIFKHPTFRASSIYHPIKWQADPRAGVLQRRASIPVPVSCSGEHRGVTMLTLRSRHKRRLPRGSATSGKRLALPRDFVILTLLVRSVVGVRFTICISTKRLCGTCGSPLTQLCSPTVPHPSQILWAMSLYARNSYLKAWDS
jgi:hypothetical protein